MLRIPKNYDELPFWIRLCWDPVRAMDLIDRNAKPDHGKLMPAALLVAVLTLKVFGITFAWYELLILASLTGGVSLVRTLIASGAIKGTGTAAVNVSSTVYRTITERRDLERGVEPTAE